MPSPKKMIQVLSLGIIILIISLPFADHTRFSFLFNRILPTRVILIVLFSFSGLYLINRYLKAGIKKLKEDLKDLLNDPYLLILLTLLVVRVISLIGSLNLKASLSLLLFFVSVIALYILLKMVVIHNRFFAFTMIRTYLYVGVGATLFGLLQLIFILKGINLKGVLVGGDFIRIPGTFFDANHFPAYLSTVAPLMLGFALLSTKRWLKFLWWGLFLVLSVVVLYTFSRSGMIALGVGTLVFLIYMMRLGFLRRIVPLLLIILALGTLILLSNRTPRSLVSRVLSVADPFEKSTVAHTLLIQGELDLFRSNPILGVGYGSFSEHFRNSPLGMEHLKIDPTPNIRLPAHSLWFEVMTETGIPGLILYATFMVLVLAYLVHMVQEVPNKTARIYGAGLFSGTVGILTGGLFYSYNLEFFWFYLFLAILFAGTMQLLYKEKVLFSDLPKEEKINWSEIAVPLFVTAIAGFLIFYQLGQSHLIDWDEAIYAGIAKNMSRNWDLLGMYWNGKYWFEKPPLFIWLTSFMVYLYGVSSFAARFFAAVFGVSGVLLTYLLARKMYNRFTAFMAALILTTSFHYVYYARNGILDVPVTFFMVAAALTFWLGRLNPKYFMLTGISLGLGIMTKGPVALLVLPAMGIFALLDWKNYKQYLNKFTAFGMGLLLAVGLPWHILEYRRFGKVFIDNYLLYHILARADSSIEGKGAGTWVYIDVIRNSFRIWFGPLLLAVVWAVWEIIRKSKEMFFLALWALFIFVAFSVSQSKLIWYIIPIYPPLAIITARFLERFFSYITAVGRKIIPLREPIYQITFAWILVLISLSYVFLNWVRIQPRDFTYDEVKMIEEKQRFETTGRIPLIMEGFAPPVPLFYSESQVIMISNGSLTGVLSNGETRYAVTTIDEAQKVIKSLQDAAIPATIVSTSGNLALIYRP